MTEPDRASTRAASAPDAVPGPVRGVAPAPAAVPVGVPDPLRSAAVALLGERLPLAERFASLLATAGVERGLIGPREAPRIWDRHLLNCAVLGELIPSGVYVVDVGSGAGLPGIVLAVARPDLRISLVESLARRTAFLNEAVEALGLSSVEVVRARAEECVNVLQPADVVTARAVAPLDRLASWCLPLARPGGVLLAIKGSSAAEEIEEHRAAVRRLGGGSPVVVQCGTRWLTEPTTVVEIRSAGTRGETRGDRGATRGDRGEARGDRGATRGDRVEKKPAGGRAGGRARSAGAGRSGGRGTQEARGARGTHGGARSGDGGDHPRT